MASLGDMNIKVGADIQDALTKINQLKQANIQLAEETRNLSAEYNKNAKELRALEDQQAKGIGVTNKTASSIKALSDRQKELTAQIVDNKGVLKQSTAVVNTYDKSVSGAGTGTTKLSKALGGLTSASDYAARGVKKLETYISAGLEGAIAGLAVVVGGAIVEAFTEWVDAINNVNKAQEKLNGELAKAAGSTAGEVANLQSLVAIARDTSLSYDTRTQAVKALNKEYPELLGHMTVENSNTALITAAINKEVEAIQRRAQVKALERLIDDAQVKLEKAKLGLAEEQGANFTTILASAKDQVKDLGNSISGLLGAPGLFGGAATSFHEAFVAPIVEAQKQIDLYSKKLAELNLESAKSGTLVLPVIPTPVKPSKEKIKKVAKETVEELSQAFALADIKSPLEDIFKTARGRVGVVLDPSVKAALDSIAKSDAATALLKQKLQETADLATNVLTPAFDALFTTIVEGSGNAFQAFGDALNQIIKQLAVTLLKAIAIGAVMAAITGKPFDISSIVGKALKGFAEGGEVKGPGSSKSDSILARLSKGEYVLKAESVKRIGVSNLDRLNQGSPPAFDSFLGGKLPRFAGGGFISPSFANNFLTGSIGGGQAIEIVGELKLRGDHLVAAVKRGNNKINRTS